MSLPEIQTRLAAALAAADRAPGSVRLIAVSKEQPDERVRAVLDQGQRIFGENKVQEAARKWPGFRQTYPEIALHLIGPLQTNKARTAFDLFDCLHALDRPRLALTLARLAQETGRCPDLFIQVNTGAEAQKSGVLPDQADAFIAECRALALPVIGLMCIPPDSEPPLAHFSQLAALAGRNGLAGLSMGMSGDFEAAVAAGATHIRVGSAIFGARSVKAGPGGGGGASGGDI